GQHGAEEARGVLRLRQRDGDDLDVGLGAEAPADGRAGLGVPVGEAAGAEQLEPGHDGGEWVLAPALEALEHGPAVDELTVLVEGVVPEDEAQLLHRELARGTRLRVLEVLGREERGLPAKGVLGEDVGLARLVLRPRWTDDDGRPVLGVEGCGQWVSLCEEIGPPQSGWLSTSPGGPISGHMGGARRSPIDIDGDPAQIMGGASEPPTTRCWVWSRSGR